MATQTGQAGRSTKKQGDFTGRQAAAQAAKAAADKKARDEEIAMITAQEQKDFEDAVFDVTDPSHPTIVDEVVEVGVHMADDSVVVRVAEDIDNMTFGYKNTFSFKAGGKYQVPKAVADRLESLGLLWH